MKEFKKFIFENVEVDVTEINGVPMFELYSTGMALGQLKLQRKHVGFLNT